MARLARWGYLSTRSSLLEDVSLQVNCCRGLACLQRCLQCLEFGFVRVCELELKIFQGLAHPLYTCNTTYRPLDQNHPAGES